MTQSRICQFFQGCPVAYQVLCLCRFCCRDLETADLNAFPSLHQSHHSSCQSRNCDVWQCSLCRQSSWTAVGTCASLSVPLPPFPFSWLDSQMGSSVNKQNTKISHTSIPTSYEQLTNKSDYFCAFQDAILQNAAYKIVQI